MSSSHNCTYYASLEDQTSSDDEEFSCGNRDFTTDARVPYPAFQQDGQRVQHTSNRIITEEIITDMEKELDFYEKVSLVYLLYDDPTIIFERLQDLQQNEERRVLFEWYQSFMQIDNWQKKLLEGLSLIQNYQLLSRLGYERSEIQEQFLTLNENTSVINGIKRILYKVCDSLSPNQIKNLLLKAERDFHDKKIKFEKFNGNHFEFYLAHWTVIHYISSTDLTNLYRVLQAIDKSEIANNLKSLVPHLIASTSSDRLDDDDGDNNNEYVTTRNEMENDKCYSIDSKQPGICLIINQEHFHRVPNVELEALLPSGEEIKDLEDREGTQVDGYRLYDTFKKFDFTVIMKKNLTSDKMELEIQNVVKKVTNHSSLIICIMSHGIEGAVYGSNSIPVEISDICNYMCKSNPNLKDKPKVLILQSCQGTNLHQLTLDGGDNDEFLQIDMPNRAVLLTRDMLILHATVPGYASFRSTTEGTWFVQSLCEAISEEAPREHFVDICTVVHNKVSKKSSKTRTGIVVCMVSYFNSTFTKKFYLPRLKNAGRN